MNILKIIGIFLMAISAVPIIYIIGDLWVKLIKNEIKDKDYKFVVFLILIPFFLIGEIIFGISMRE